MVARNSPDEYPETNTGIRVPFTPSQRPRATEADRRHILRGSPDGTGGHRYGTGRPGKSEFRKDWPDDGVMDAIDRTLASPDYIEHHGDQFVSFRRIEGELVRVSVRTDLGKPFIWTAYPVRNQE